MKVKVLGQWPAPLQARRHLEAIFHLPLFRSDDDRLALYTPRMREAKNDEAKTKQRTFSAAVSHWRIAIAMSPKARQVFASSRASVQTNKKITTTNKDT